MTDTRTDQKTDQEFTPIETQEQLDRILGKRLKAERERVAELEGELEEARKKLAAKDGELAGARLDAEIQKRGIVDPNRIKRIKKLVDLEGDSEVTEQLETLASEVPELFKVPKGVGSGGSSKPVLPKEEPLTREEIEAMSPEQLNRPGIREKVDAFLRGERS